MKTPPFYASGLRFSCRRCSACCRYESGFVFLSEQDLALLASRFRMPPPAFIAAYCRWVEAPGGMEELSLREVSGYDCVFWKDGCAVYDDRPLQCRTFPFWASVLASEKAWSSAALSCPGVGQGGLHDRASIESCLEKREAEPVISRPRGGIQG